MTDQMYLIFQLNACQNKIYNKTNSLEYLCMLITNKIYLLDFDWELFWWRVPNECLLLGGGGGGAELWGGEAGDDGVLDEEVVGVVELDDGEVKLLELVSVPANIVPTAGVWLNPNIVKDKYVYDSIYNI
jgi:hypothetical protein